MRELERLLEARETSRKAVHTYPIRTAKIYHDKEGNVSTGTAVMLGPDGHFITNLHVLPLPYNPKTTTTTIEMYDPNTRRRWQVPLGRVLQKHTSYDLVLGRCELPSSMQHTLRQLPPVVLGNDPEIGDRVTAYGFRFDHVEERNGLVLGRAGSIRLDTFGKTIADELHELTRAKLGVAWYADTHVDRGFSGGPTVHRSTGELTGITFMMAEFFGCNSAVIDKEHGYVNSTAVRILVQKYLEQGRR